MKALRYSALVSVVIALFGVVAVGNAANDPSTGRPYERSSGNQGFDSFPLWIDVPGQTYITLNEDRLSDGTRWGVYASRVGQGQRGQKNPCLSVARITRAGGYGDAHRCGEPTPEGNQPPVYVSITGSYQNRPSGPEIGESVMGLSFRVDVQRVKLVFADSGSMTRPTKLVNAAQRRKTGLPAFRYVALGLQRDVCVETVIGYDQTGESTFEAPTRLC